VLGRKGRREEEKEKEDEKHFLGSLLARFCLVEYYMEER